ncbi:MAG TPA: hypothetical protein VM889_03965 [Candidatus Thermoplasmatota archaeon]|nr:hypothetical protein [Candidatus Thermoplasmatota archaeon]
MDGRRALLAGATGLVGSRILRILEADPRVAAIEVLARRPVEGGAKVASRAVDFAALPQAAPGGPIDDVYVALGTTMAKAGSRAAFRAVDFEAVVAVAKVGLARGATRCAFVSSVGADPSSRVFYSRVKGEAEEALRRLGFASLHLVRPSLLLGERGERRRGERAGIVVARLADPVLRGPLARFRAIRAEDVARAMVRAVATGVPGVTVHEGEALRALAQA